MIARSAHRFRIINIVAAITVAALIAASCGSDDATATPEPVTETTTTVNQPTTTVEAVEEPLAVTTTTTTVVALTEDQVAEIQQEIAEEAAPESELSLADCTAWIADPEIVLTDQQASECDAMLVAVAESCVGMDCPGDDSTEPDTTETPVTTLPPQEEEPEPEPEPTTTTAAPQPEPEPEPTTTTTAPAPEPEPPTLVVDPDVVSEGLTTFTITGANFDPSLTIWTLLCSLPGASLSPDSPADQVAAAMDSVETADCDLSTAQPVDTSSDGSFTIERDVIVQASFMWAAGDDDDTQSAGAVVFFDGTAATQPEPEPGGDEATNLHDATTVAIFAMSDLLSDATELWESGNVTGACVLVAEARSIANAHEARYGIAASEDERWEKWPVALAKWEDASERRQSQPTTYDTFVESVQQGNVWVADDAPPIHPDTPQTSWDRGTWEIGGGLPDDRARITPIVQDFLDWCGRVCDDGYLLFVMVWAVDYMGADERCVIANYYAKISRTGAPGNQDRYGWHRCPTVIDPREPTVADSFIQEIVPGLLLLAPNDTPMAERCRAALPEDVELEERISGGVIRDGLDCDEWGAWVEARRVSYPACDRSARLAEEWLEHYFGMPERYWRISC